MTLLSVCIPDAGAGWLPSFLGKCTHFLSTLTHKQFLKIALKGKFLDFQPSIFHINVAIVTPWILTLHSQPPL